MNDLPSRDEVRALLAVVDEASTMGADPIVRYPTLRRVLDAYVEGVDMEAAYLMAAQVGIDTPEDVDWFLAGLGIR